MANYIGSRIVVPDQTWSSEMQTSGYLLHLHNVAKAHEISRKGLGRNSG